MNKKLIQYGHNNSGGHDWLTKDDWLNLEKAGWRVAWEAEKRFEDDMLYTDGNYTYDSEGLPICLFNKPQKNYRCPMNAYKYFDSIDEAIEEFEEITKEDATEEGCPCCGNPHYFDIEDSPLHPNNNEK